MLDGVMLGNGNSNQFNNITATNNGQVTKYVSGSQASGISVGYYNAGSIHNAPTQNTFNGFLAYDFQGSPTQSYGLYVASNCPQNTFVSGNLNNNKVAAKSILASACYYAGSTAGVWSTQQT